MAVVELGMSRHRQSIHAGVQDAGGIERYRYHCSCGWRSLPYRPTTLGRARGESESRTHAEMFPIYGWEVL